MIDEILTIFFVISIVTFMPSTLVAILPRRRRMEGFYPPVSVVIPAHNEESCIESTVDSVFKSDYPNEIDVVVVDDGSSDGTCDILSRLAGGDGRIRVINTDHLGKALAVNKGIMNSKNEIIVMLDADSTLSKDALRRFTEPFIDAAVGAVSGIIAVKTNGNPLTWYQDFEYVLSSMWRYIFDRVGGTYILPGFAAFRRKAIVEAGLFATDTLSEDCDIGLSMRKRGWQLIMSGATMYTTAPQTLGGIAKQRIRWGRGALQVMRKHRDMFLNPRYGFIGFYGLPNQLYFYIQGSVILPITFYQIFHGYMIYFAQYGNYLSWLVVKYFIGWLCMFGTIEYVHNTLTGVWPMSASFPYFLASMLVITAYNVIAALRMSRLTPRVPLVLFFFFPYYLFTLTFFCFPLILELNPLKKAESHVNIWEKTR
ncbi:MAG: glycosyltransferase family 2 protein [Candidatus Altiarchaeota archaeon]